MGRTHSNEDFQREKAKQYKIKVTSYIQGEVKTKFMNDCIRRGVTECTLIKEIIVLHYAMTSKYMLEGKEFNDIKRQLL
jgi:hypothetical protein